MFKYFYIILALLFLTFPQLGKAQKQENDYILPLKLPVSFSGNFAEIRGTHFHAGIDFKTRRTIGHPVYAVKEGVLSRIVVSPTGYGKALYIDHPDGNTSVYAHLESFDEHIQHLTREKQYAEKSFSIDWDVLHLNIQVKQGDIIGFSGNTGSSQGPHLHFEVRHTATQQPINPLLYTYPQLPDTRSPILQGLMVYAREVDEQNQQKYYPLKKGKNKHYHFDKKTREIHTYGAVSFGIQGLDHINGSYNRCGFFRVQLWIDDSLYYQHSMDTISFSQQHFVRNFLDYRQYHFNKRRVQRSTIDHNNKLQIYEKGSGVFMPYKARHHIQYLVSDVKGNQASISFDIVPKAYPEHANKELNKSKYPYILCDKAYVFHQDAFKINLPAKTFYTNQAGFKLAIHKHKPAIPDQQSPVYSIHDEGVAPSPHPVVIGVKLQDKQKQIASKLFWGQITEKQVNYISSTVKQDSLLGKLNFWGNYGIFIDTVAPSIKFKQISTSPTGKNSRRICFIIDDAESGIKDYSGTINGAWALFEHDPKTGQLFHTMKAGDFTDSTISLKVKVTDHCGNSNEILMEHFNIAN